MPVGRRLGGRAPGTPGRWAARRPWSVALGLGSNVGPGEATLLRAVAVLSRFLAEVRIAPLYRTAPVSPIPQRPYLNTAVVGRTELPPDALLAVGKVLERQAGRRLEARLGPRPLDIDLLLFGRRVSAAPELTLPHPRLRRRPFVLVPLADLVPDLPVPPDGSTVRQLLDELQDPGEVERLEWRHSWSDTVVYGPPGHPSE